MDRRIAWLAAVLALTPALARAEREGPFTRSALSLSVDGAQDRARGGDPTWSTASFSARASTNLAGQATLEPEGLSAWGLRGAVDTRTFSADLPGIDGGARFLRLGLSLGASWLTPSRETYWLQVGAFAAEQTTLLGSPRLHLQVMALGTWRAAETVKLLYGLGYTFDFGIGLPLPFLGVEWRWAPAWSLNVLLPLLARVTWKASDQLSIGMGTSVAGDYFRYRAQDPSSAMPVRELHVARLRLGVGARYDVSTQVHLGLELGVEGASLDDGVSTERGTGLFAQASCRFGASHGSAAPY